MSWDVCDVYTCKTKSENQYFDKKPVYGKRKKVAFKMVFHFKKKLASTDKIIIWISSDVIFQSHP